MQTQGMIEIAYEEKKGQFNKCYIYPYGYY